MIQSLDLEYDIGVLSFDDETYSGDDSDSSHVFVCDMINSNDITPVMFSGLKNAGV